MDLSQFLSAHKNRHKILLLHFGGTIAMLKNEKNELVPQCGNLITQISKLPGFTEFNNLNISSEISKINLTIPSEINKNSNIISDLFFFNYKNALIAIYEAPNLIDSCNVTVHCWHEMIAQIEKYKTFFNKMLILHGTDTMAYTTSALATYFGVSDLSIVVTGGISPLPDEHAIGNLVESINLLIFLNLNEIVLYFDKTIFRGDCVTKIYTEQINAFASFNSRPRGGFNEIENSFWFKSSDKKVTKIYVGKNDDKQKSNEVIDEINKICENKQVIGEKLENERLIEYNSELNRDLVIHSEDEMSSEELLQNLEESKKNDLSVEIEALRLKNELNEDEIFCGEEQSELEEEKISEERKENLGCSFKPNFSEKVVVVKLFPNFNPSVLRFYAENGIRGIVLETFGSGGGPTKNSGFVETIKYLIKNKIVVVSVSQCLSGSVCSMYETAHTLGICGVLSGTDMTTECAYAKLSLLVGQGMTFEEIVEVLTRSCYCRNDL